MLSRPCLVKMGDLVQSKKDADFFGFVTWIDENSETGEYYVEVQFNEEMEPLYFYDDELIVHKLFNE